MFSAARESRSWKNKTVRSGGEPGRAVPPKKTISDITSNRTKKQIANSANSAKGANSK